MEFKPVDLRDLEVYCSNVYEAVIVASKRARQLNAENKLDYNTQLSAIAPGIEDDFEERENPDQLRISLEFENKPKSHLLAIQELMDGEIEFKYKDEEPVIEKK